jgi:hypothetical protein
MSPFLIDNQTPFSQTGTFTILVSPHGTPGSLTIQVAGDLIQTTTLGGIVNFQTTIPGQNDAVTFAGTAGQRFAADLAYGDSSTCAVSASYTITSPDGSTLQSGGMPLVQCALGGNLEVYVDPPITLPLTGTYRVTINPAGTSTGSGYFYLYNVPPDASASATMNGGAVNIGTTVPFQDSQVTFSGNAGQLATVHITNNNTDITVSLLDPNGSVVTSAPESTAASFNLPQVTLSLTGTYTIKINTNYNYTGSQSVSVTSP